MDIKRANNIQSKNYTALLTISATLVFLTGCDTIGHQKADNVTALGDPRTTNTLILGADRRAVFERKVKITETDVSKFPNTTIIKEGVMHCAEPQPDAIRALATELAAALKVQVPSGTNENIEAGGSVSRSAREAIAELGRRTPTIQLMRDTLYRTCEATMNGVLHSHHVQFIASRIDNIMIGLHAIDGLTQAGSGSGAAIFATATMAGEAKVDADAKNPTAKTTPTTLTVTQGQASAPTSDTLKALETMSGDIVKIVAIVLMEGRSAAETEANSAGTKANSSGPNDSEILKGVFGQARK